jgi:lysozyme family protein
VSYTESDIQSTIHNIIQREGGYSYLPNDHGGETWYGVTEPFALQWHIPWPPTLPDVNDGYRRMLAGTKIDQIPDYPTFDLVADCAVNDGSKGIKWLQATVGVVADGVIGPKTLGAMQTFRIWRTVYVSVLRSRFKFYASIVQNNSSQLSFLGGWINRACEFLT